MERCPIDLDYALRQPEMIAQIDEQQIAVIAFAVNPAGQTGLDPAFAARSSPQLWVR